MLLSSILRTVAGIGYEKILSPYRSELITVPNPSADMTPEPSLRPWHMTIFPFILYESSVSGSQALEVYLDAPKDTFGAAPASIRGKLVPLSSNVLIAFPCNQSKV